MTAPLLRLDNIRKGYPINTGGLLRQRRGRLWALDGVSFEVRRGETVGIVGESGCGKTTTAKVVLRLEQPTSGELSFDGQPVGSLGGEDLKRFRASVQAVFQDPWSALNPRMRIGQCIAEPLKVNTKLERKAVAARVEELLRLVGLHPWQARLYPHEFSGGQRQRIALARALALNPRLIVLDEPVSALDVSVQAQVMNLLRDVQEELGLSFLLIAHNLGAVRYLCHRVVVMYLGQVVEEASAEDLFDAPRHPYTQALLAAALPSRPGEYQEELPLLEGEIPSPAAPPSGCRFHTRCPHATEPCTRVAPDVSVVAEGHTVRCHLYGRATAAAA